MEVFVQMKVSYFHFINNIQLVCCVIPLNVSQKKNISEITTIVWEERENRSSHQRCSVKKGVLRNFTKFTGKHLYQSLSRRFWHRFFPVNVVKFLRIAFYIEHLWWLLFDKTQIDAFFIWYLICSYLKMSCL